MKRKAQGAFAIFRYQSPAHCIAVRPPLSKGYQSWANAVRRLQAAAQPKPLAGEVGLFDLPVVESIRGQL